MNNGPPIVLSLCDRTGVAVRDWAAAGFECWCVDLQHPAGVHRGPDNIVRVGADVRYWLPPRRDYAFAMGFPPCTDLSVSGARWFKAKGLRRLAKAIDVFGAVTDRLEWCECPGWAENPVSVIASHYRRADYSFHPWEYAGYLPDPEAENTTKRTNLWAFGGFAMPPPRPALFPHRSDCFLAPPSPDRGDLRSVWPAGFARAVYLANARTVGKEAARE